MDWPVIEQKLESLRRSLRRVEEKRPKDADALAKDIDAQDILSLNLTRAVQIYVDIGAHLISGTELPPPDTMGQTFDVLYNAGMISADLAVRMKKAVGFRNLAVHNYNAINWAIVYSIAQSSLQDFGEFAKSVAKLQDKTRENK
ncbi:MAG: hypothetical protein CVV13_13975 [Gammaproteobacteria bacterium HGW-Gammaproteobacteria-3]|nr:MAG: hypothetical protein CVV13_13975 [Gammaproteobacteria bacterium HGW-Gammaproteobacteria-3]